MLVVQLDVLVPAASHIDFTCHLCTVLAFNPVKVIEFVFVVSKDQELDESSLYI